MDLSFLFAQAQVNSTQEWVDKIARTPLSQIVALVGVLTIVRVILGFTVLKPVPVHYQSNFHGVGKFINELCDAIIYAGVFVFLVIRPFVLQTFVIPSGSMVKTLLVGDMIIANKWVYRNGDPKHGDIIVFKPPKQALKEGHEDDDFIKRCIGIPGDTIEIRNNVLYRNGQAVNEPHKAFTKRDQNRPTEEVYVDMTDAELAAMQPIDFKLVEFQGKVWPLNKRGELVNQYGLTAPEYELTDLQVMKQMWDLPLAKVPDGYYLMMGDNRYGSFDSRGWGLVPRKSVIGRAEAIFFPIGRMSRTE